MNSKKYKLPKEFWEKGKSKFLFCRLEEDKNFINPYLAMASASLVLTVKPNFWQKLINWLKNLIK